MKSMAVVYHLSEVYYYSIPTILNSMPACMVIIFSAAWWLPASVAAVPSDSTWAGPCMKGLHGAFGAAWCSGMKLHGARGDGPAWGHTIRRAALRLGKEMRGMGGGKQNAA